MFKRISGVSLLVAFVFMIICLGGCGQANDPAQQSENKEIILATTTSTVDSGLLDVLLPEFTQKTGYTVKPIPAGTGQALALGEKGEADALLVHAPQDEQKLVDSGVAINYQLVMHNDFIIVGPENDPAGIKQAKTGPETLQKIADTESTFISRGDESGTHKKEMAIWKAAGIEPSGKWYQQAGSGMGQTLTIASEKEGYTLTDRGTFLARQQGLKLVPLMEGDQSLLNIYHVMQVNSEKFPQVNTDGGKAFVEFMIAPETQETIGKFGVEQYGQPLFYPDAGKNEADLGK